MRRTRLVIASAVAVAGLAVGAVIADAVRDSTAVVAPVAAPIAASAGDIQRLNEALAAQGGTGDAVWLDRTLSETLSNFKVSWDGAPGVRIFDATVEGRVLDVRPGTSHRDSVGDDDIIVREDLEFDDKTAMWRTLVLTVEVLRDFDPASELATKVEVVLWLDGTTDPEIVRKGFQGQRIFAVLEGPGRLDPGTAYPVARNGALIGVVLEDGSFSMPGLGEDEKAYLAGLTTMDAIDAAAKQPSIEVSVSTAKGFWERTG